MIVTMPWGKFKGKAVSRLTDSYLDYVLENLSRVNPVLKAALVAEKDRRNKIKSANYSPSLSFKPRKSIPKFRTKQRRQ